MRMILKWTLRGLFGLILVACLYIGNLFSDRPLSLNHFLAKELLTQLFESPEVMTSVGLFDDFNWLTQHNDKLSLGSEEEALSRHAATLKRRDVLATFEETSLSPDEQITLAIAKFDVNNTIDSFEQFRYHNFPFNQIGGAHLNLVEFMTDLHPINTEQQAWDFIRRVEQFDESSEARLNWLQRQAKQGIYPPDFVFGHVIRQLSELIQLEDHPITTMFSQKTSELDLTAAQQGALQSALSAAMSEHLVPGFDRLLKHFEETRPLANPHDGAWALPKGAAYYAHRLKIYTTTDQTAEDIHQTGLEEVARIESRMLEILTQLGYDGNQSVGALMNALNEDPQFLYPDTPDRKDKVVADYNQMVVDATETITPYFNRMPKAAVEVRAVPEYSEQNAAGGYYMSPSLDGSRPGVFYANLYDIKQTPTYSMQTLAFHEAVPGHHLQNALNQENESLSLYRKHGYYTSAYGEGWALYAERLATEAGLLTSDYDELGVLQSELFRAVRLVVDTGLHHKRWTREEAMAYMKRITGMSDTEVQAEIERYIVWPGQACSYKVGMLSILELRERARNALGDRFSIQDFHSLILDHGEPPLFVLDKLVDDWIVAES